MKQNNIYNDKYEKLFNYIDIIFKVKRNDLCWY